MKKIKNRIQNQFKDSDKKEILSKGFSFLVFSLSGTLAGYLFTLFVARNFGASVNGLIAISFSIFMMATMLGRLGIDINLVKYYSDENVIRADTGTFFKMLLKALVFSSLIGVSVYLLRDLISIKIFGKEQLIPYLKWISFAIPLWVSTLLCASFFRAIRKNKTYAFLNNAGRFLVTLILAVGLYYFISKDELITIQAHFYALVCLAIGSFIAVLFYLKPIRIKSDYNSWKFLKESFPMMLSSAILVVLGWIDTFILGIFESDDVVGIYSVSLKIATLTSFGLQAINSILAPKISAAYKQEDKITFKKLIRFSTRLNFLITLLLISVIIIFHRCILEFFGEEFLAGSIILLILCIGQVVNSLSGSVGVILQMTGHQIKFRNFVLIALITNIILNLTFTPIYGAIAIAVSTVISMALWNLLGTIYLKKKLNIITYYNFR
ncbi:MAG: flippase [Mesonia sp.]|uniref:flippase n=1 Tax=Mesonia sp. TaxID=1960830 RepID=UPI003241ECC7